MFGDEMENTEGEYAEEEMAKIIKRLCGKVEESIIYEGRYGEPCRMVNQDAEKRIGEIAKAYTKKTGYLPEKVFDRLIEAFKNCQNVRFFWSDIEKTIEEAIENLEKMKEERSLEKWRMIQGQN